MASADGAAAPLVFPRPPRPSSASGAGPTRPQDPMPTHACLCSTSAMFVSSGPFLRADDRHGQGEEPMNLEGEKAEVLFRTGPASPRASRGRTAHGFARTEETSNSCRRTGADTGFAAESHLTVWSFSPEMISGGPRCRYLVSTLASAHGVRWPWPGPAAARMSARSRSHRVAAGLPVSPRMLDPVVTTAPLRFNGHPDGNMGTHWLTESGEQRLIVGGRRTIARGHRVPNHWRFEPLLRLNSRGCILVGRSYAGSTGRSDGGGLPLRRTCAQRLLSPRPDRLAGEAVGWRL